MVAAGLLLVPMPANAQVTCGTGNCAVGTTGGIPNVPPECQSIATPRLIEVRMNTASGPYGDISTFIPSNVRIEGESPTPGVPWAYQCIQWHKTGSSVSSWHSATENTDCNMSDFCSSTNITPPCDWETSNIDNLMEFGVCHYRNVAPASYGYHCRLHGTPSSGMRGTLTVVPPITLLVDRNASGVLLDWTIGGVGPWNVWRDSSPSMPAPVNLTPGGTSVSLFTDPTPAVNVYYLVEERN